MPTHQLFGHPLPIQGNDMDLEAQLVSNGIYCGGPEGYISEKAKNWRVAAANGLCFYRLILMMILE